MIPPYQTHPAGDLPIRITAEVRGRPVKLFSAHIQQPTGDLIIDPKPGTHRRPDPESWVTDQLMHNAKIQIHVSEKSPDGNTITFTINRKMADEKKDVQFTKAIKSNNKFTPVCARLFPDLRHEERQIDDRSGQSYRIAKFDPKYISLISVVYVGRLGLRHAPSIGKAYNTMHISAGMFEICIMSTFVNLPSIPHANMLFYKTSKEYAYEDYADIIEGFSGKSMDNNTIKMTRLLTDAYIDQCKNSLDAKLHPYTINSFEEIRHASIKYSSTPYFERLPKSPHTLLTDYLVNLFISTEIDSQSP